MVRSRIARYSAAVVIGVSVRRAIAEMKRYRATDYSSLNRTVAEHLEAVRRILMLGDHIGGLWSVLLLNQSEELAKGQVGGIGLQIVDRLSHDKTSFLNMGAFGHKKCRMHTEGQNIQTVPIFHGVDLWCGKLVYMNIRCRMHPA